MANIQISDALQPPVRRGGVRATWPQLDNTGLGMSVGWEGPQDHLIPQGSPPGVSAPAGFTEPGQRILSGWAVWLRRQRGNPAGLGGTECSLPLQWAQGTGTSIPRGGGQHWAPSPSLLPHLSQMPSEFSRALCSGCEGDLGVRWLKPANYGFGSGLFLSFGFQREQPKRNMSTPGILGQPALLIHTVPISYRCIWVHMAQSYRGRE